MWYSTIAHSRAPRTSMRISPLEALPARAMLAVQVAAAAATDGAGVIVGVVAGVDEVVAAGDGRDAAE